MNRRSERTKREISEAFLALLSEKPIQKITVKELTDKADISRATFYTHYHDVYELLEYTRADAIAYITDLLDKALPDGDITAFTHELFLYFNERRELFSLIIGDNGDISFLVSALRELGSRQINRLAETSQNQNAASIDEQLLHYQFIFISGGVLHMLTEWASSDDTLAVEEVAHITAELIESVKVVNTLCATSDLEIKG